MDFISLLSKTKSNIVISSRDQRRSLFEMTKDLDFLYDIKFISFNDLIDDLLGSYLKKAVIPVKDKYKITYSGAENYLSYFLLTDDKEKEFVKEYFVFDEYNINYYKDKNIIISLNSSYSNLIHKCINILKENDIPISYLDIKEVNDKNHQVFEADDMIKEIELLAYNISSLIKDGVDINNIYVEVLSDSYLDIISDVFPFYNIEYTEKTLSNLISHEACIKLLDYYNRTNEKIDLESFNEYIKSNYIEETIKTKIESILSQEVEFTLDYFRYELEDSYISDDEYKDSVTIKPFMDSIIYDDSYYFIVGANESFFPKTIMLPGLFNDNVIKKYNLLNEKELNERQEKYYIDKINSIKNLYISYKLKDEEKEYIKASLIDRLSDNKYIKEINIDNRSKDRGYLNYLKGKELYNKYDYVSNNYINYYNNFKDVDEELNAYKNNFKISDEKTFKDYLNKKLKLSFSSLNEYNECPFKYLLDKVFKLNKFSDSYSTFVGSFFHYYIENTIEEEFDETRVNLLLSEFYNDEKLNKYELTEPEQFFFDFLFLPSLKDIHDGVKNRYDELNKKAVYKEETYRYKYKKKDFDITFEIRPDMLIEDVDNNVLIIDYKTGKSPTFDLENVKCFQLFIYYNIYNKENPKTNFFGGFYLKIDKVGDGKIGISGKSVNDPNMISNFGADEFCKSKSTKLSSEEIKEYLNKTDELIENTTNDILNLKFEMTPDTKSCRYCKFQEICNKSEGIDELEEEIEDATIG